ncbi:MAG TPA: thioredoxin domain-containing protein [Pyrinomonadaceae bacterium]|nr:thioredoxin domain-containing protein [Pyrinomonadaceae bacterium]
MKRILPFIIILAVLGIALVSAWYFTRSMPVSTTAAGSQQPQPQGSSAPQAAAQNPPVVSKGVPGAEPAHVLGPANAPARLEEFGDFECPPCGMFHPILVEMHKEFGDKLQITFREYPLVPTHQHALAAASAAEAAGMQGKFWEMHDLLYERQKDWKTQFDVRPVFEGYAKEIGLDVERYNRDVASDAVAQRIFLDGKRGHSLGVTGTPTVFVNGREVPFQSLPADQLRVILQREIEKK